MSQGNWLTRKQKLLSTYHASPFAQKMQQCFHAYDCATPNPHHPENDNESHTNLVIHAIEAFIQTHHLDDRQAEILWVIAQGHDFGKVFTRQVDSVHKDVHFPKHDYLSPSLYHQFLMDAGLVEHYVEAGMLYTIYLAMALHLASLQDLLSNFSNHLSDEKLQRWSQVFIHNPDLFLPLLAINIADETGDNKFQEQPTFTHYPPMIDVLKRAALSSIGEDNHRLPIPLNPETFVSQLITPAIWLAVGANTLRERDLLKHIGEHSPCVYVSWGHTLDVQTEQPLWEQVITGLEEKRPVVIHNPPNVRLENRSQFLNHLRQAIIPQIGAPIPVNCLALFAPVCHRDWVPNLSLALAENYLPPHFGEAPSGVATRTYDRIYAAFSLQDQDWCISEYLPTGFGNVIDQINQQTLGCEPPAPAPHW